MSDKYRSIAALTEAIGPNAFRITCSDRNSNVTIIAPHGGFIEPGTSALSLSVAGSRYNLFDFQGLQEAEATELHVTATRFRHPDLCRLLHKSAIALAIHGMGNQGHSSIWLGGLNAELKQLCLRNLRGRGFSVEPNSPRYRGVHKQNLVNLASYHGVQLEIPNELLQDLFASPPYFSLEKAPARTPRFRQLVRALRLSLAEWHHHRRGEPVAMSDRDCCCGPDNQQSA